MTDQTTDKAALISQRDAAYTTLSASKGKACANCRWFNATGEYGADCQIIDCFPKPILPTGYCERWELLPEVEPEPLEVVVITEEPEIEEDDSGEMMMAQDKPSLVQRVRSWFSRAPDGGEFKVFKGGDGAYWWHARHTNNFEDKDSEILSEKAHDNYIWRLDNKLVDMPELWGFHTPGTRHGVAKSVWRNGHFIHAIGTFDDTPAAKSALKFYRTTKDTIKLSHGFTFPKWAFKNGIYEVYNTFEISTLPNGAEANPYTSFEEIEKMATMAEPKRRFLEGLFGGKEGLDALHAEDEKAAKALVEMGARYKDFATPEEPDTASKEADDTTVYLEVVKQQHEIISVLSGVDAAMKAVTATNTALAAQVKALETRLTEYDNERKQAPRIASQAVSTVVTDEKAAQFKADYDAQMADYDPAYPGMKVRKEVKS